MSSLRDEIIESERAKSDLLKWKLIGASVLGAAGLGFTQNTAGAASYLVLPIIPLVCFYVDLLCRHESLRIMVIAAFLRLKSDEDEETEYEDFVKEIARSGGSNIFLFEDLALEWSTIGLSLILTLAGAIIWIRPGLLPTIAGHEQEFSGLAASSGIVVLFMTFWLKSRFNKHVKALDDLT